jgi:hypothetical protein
VATTVYPLEQAFLIRLKCYIDLVLLRHCRGRHGGPDRRSNGDHQLLRQSLENRARLQDGGRVWPLSEVAQKVGPQAQTHNIYFKHGRSNPILILGRTKARTPNPNAQYFICIEIRLQDWGRVWPLLEVAQKVGPKPKILTENIAGSIITTFWVRTKGRT